MDLPDDFDMNKIMPILSSFGISPEALGPDKLAKLQSIANSVDDPSQITQEKARQVLDVMGIDLRGGQEQVVRKSKKIGRNDSCPCGSKLKWKKCCGKHVAEKSEV